jgi:hypothetical protein
MKLNLIKKEAKLIPIGKQGKTKTEDVYTYESEDKAVKLTFHASPTNAWNWTMVRDDGASNSLGMRRRHAIICAFIEAISGTNKPWDDVIKVLVIGYW